MVFPIQRPNNNYNTMFQNPSRSISQNMNFNRTASPQSAVTSFANKSFGNISKTLNNVQQVIKVVQSATPVVQEYGPMVKNIPAMYRMVKALKDVENDNIEDAEGTLKDKPNIKADEITSTVEDLRVDSSGQSTPKLFI